MSSYSYIRSMFCSAAAKSGGIVRRRSADVRRVASHDALLQEVKRLGYHLIEAGDQYIVVCNVTKIQVHC